MGIKANEFLKDGKLVPDEITVGVVDERFLNSDIDNGFIMDGFPRTVNQAVEFDRILLSKLKELKTVILLDISEAQVVKRISGRRVCQPCGTIFHIENIPSKVDGICDACGGTLIQRKDDNEVVIKDRLLEYNKLTAPLIDYYKDRNILAEIDASTIPSVMFDAIKELDI